MSWYPGTTTGWHRLKIFTPPSRLVPSRGAWMYVKICQSSLSINSAPWRQIHARMPPQLLAWSHSFLSSTSVTVENIRADDTNPSYPVRFSKAWLLKWRHHTMHSHSDASSKKKMSSRGRRRTRGHLQLRGQLSGPNSEQELLLKSRIGLMLEIV